MSEQEQRLSIEEKMQQILKIIDDGALHITEVAAKTGLSTKTISQYAWRSDVRLHPKFQANRKKRVAALAQEGKTLDEIITEIGLGYGTVKKYLHKENIQVNKSSNPIKPRTRVCKRKPHIDELIAKGYILEEMAKTDGVTREAIRTYINRSGQYSFWRQQREAPITEQKNREEVTRQLISILKQRTLQLAYQESWAQGKTEEYFQSLHRVNKNPRPREKLVKLFEAYKKAEETGENTSFEEIGSVVGYKAPNVRWILNKVGITSLNFTKQYFPRNKRQNEVFIELIDLGLTKTDAAYFCEVTYSTVEMRMQRLGRKVPNARLIKQFSPNIERLTYRLASQVYEAQDLRFENTKIAKLLGVNSKVVDYAIEHRETIAPTIIKAIEIIRGSKPDVPYLQSARINDC